MDVTVEPEDAGFLVKLQADGWEINVHASRADLEKLSDIHDAVWNERRSIRAGDSAGAPVFWASKGDDVTLMIGHDDETWDVAVTIPVGAVEEIVRESARG